MKTLSIFCCAFLLGLVLTAGCSNRPSKSPPPMVVKYSNIQGNYHELRMRARASEPDYERWISLRQPLTKHLPAWLKGTVAVRARIVEIHTPWFYSPSVSEERFYVILKVARGQHVPGHPGLRVIKLYHGCVGLVSLRFIKDRKIGAVWRIAFTPKGQAVGVILQ